MTTKVKRYQCPECGTPFVSISDNPKCCGVPSHRVTTPPIKKERLELGSTDGGRSQFKQVIPKRDPLDEPKQEKFVRSLPGDYRIRVLPAARSHATRRTKRNTGIRKVGYVWR